MKRYYLGNYVRQRIGGMDCFAPPAGVVGAIDLAPLSVQGTLASDRPAGLFVTTAAVLSSEYTLLGIGDCREMAAESRMQDAFRTLVGYRPQGDKLVDLIYDVLTDGSDPRGETGPKPLMPQMNGWCDVYLGGHSRIVGSRFEWGKPCSRGRGHWQKVKQLLRDEFDELFKAAKDGKLKDAEHHRRVLDFNCEKYGLKGEDWKELVPTKLHKDVPGRLKHETTISENFTRADSGTLMGNLLSWTQISGTWGTSSNQGYKASPSDTVNFTRAESDVSSSDHYSQVSIAKVDPNHACGPAARFSSSATTCYVVECFGGNLEILKYVAGVQTNLTSGAFSWVNPSLLKVECNGSTIKGYAGGVEKASSTDTAISGNTRGGMMHFAANTLADDFEAADLGGGGGGGPVYTQLERSTRGLNRGMYTKWS